MKGLDYSFGVLDLCQILEGFGRDEILGKRNASVGKKRAIVPF